MTWEHGRYDIFVNVSHIMAMEISANQLHKFQKEKNAEQFPSGVIGMDYFTVPEYSLA